MSNDVGKKAGMNWLALSLLSTLIAAAAGVAFLFLPTLMPQTSTDIVMIRAEEGPFKVKPIDSGGKIITNQKSQVMDMLGDLAPKTEEVEILLPPSGAPELPPVAIKTLPTPEVTVMDDKVLENTKLASAEKESTTNASATPNNDAAALFAKSDTQSNVKNSGGAELSDLPIKNPSTAIIAKPNQTKPEKKHMISPHVVSDPNEPTYIVQLAAFRKENSAAEQAGLLIKKHEKRLKGATLGTTRVNTGDNGVFWRVVSEPLPRESADTICASLKRAGQDCILRKFTPPSQ